MVLDPLRSDHLTSFDEFQRAQEDVELAVVNTQSVAVEALGLEQSIHLLDHERIVERTHQFDVAVVTSAKVRRLSARAAGFISISER